MVDLSVTQSQEGTDRLEITDAMYDIVLEVECRHRKRHWKVKHQTHVADPEQDAACIKRKDFENNLALATPDRYASLENLALDCGEAKIVDVLADPHKNKVRLDWLRVGGLLMAVFIQK